MTSERVALVTGANRGIGLEVCRQLAAQGLTVLLGARDQAKGEAAVSGLPGTVRAVALDVSRDASVEALRERVEREYGRLDVLVNNAGILYDDWEDASTADLATVQEAFNTNTLGAWRTCKAFVPLLRQGRSPRIVNVSSVSGSLSNMREAPAYSVSKAALNALTVLLAVEVQREGILVNAVCPGWVATDMGGAGGRPVSEGAASIMWAVTLPDHGPTGGFFQDGRRLRW